MKTLPLLLTGLLAAQPAGAAFPVKEFVEQQPTNNSSNVYDSFKRSARKKGDDTLIVTGLRANFRKYTDRVNVPGFISASAIPEIAQVIGPGTIAGSFRLGDTIYLRWSGTPGPREGDRYNTYSPAIVMQSLLDPTEFSVRQRPAKLQEIPGDFRMAGFFYEISGTVRVVRVRQGTVEAVIERLSGQLSTGDQLMPLIPVKNKITPVTGGIQLAAAVVCGSPADRLSTTERSFIYINRGARDGIKEGRVFQAVESVRLEGPVSGPAPERSLGEAMVVHVTDSYSTAMITKQFEVIRIGSLLKTRQELGDIPSGAAFADLIPATGSTATSPTGVPEVPEIGDVGARQDPSLPEPGRTRKGEASLSELDALEKSLQLNKLTPEERARLGRLSRQEKLDAEPRDEDEDGAPAITAPQNSFGKPKTDQKKKPKKSRPQDEEELNLLMMEN